MASTPPPTPPLAVGVYLISPNEFEQVSLPVWDELILLGCALQLRSDFAHNKQEKMALARKLVEMCRAHQRPLIVNNSQAKMQALHADGVHLGRTDEDWHNFKKEKNIITGASCYNSLSDAQQRLALGADYVSFGACFVSQTKPNAVVLSLKNVLPKAVQLFGDRVVAIGGIDAKNCENVYATGVRRLAISAGVFQQKNPIEALESIRRLCEF